VVTGFFRLNFELSLSRAQDRGDSRVSSYSGRETNLGRRCLWRVRLIEPLLQRIRSSARPIAQVPDNLRLELLFLLGQGFDKQCNRLSLLIIAMIGTQPTRN